MESLENKFVQLRSRRQLLLQEVAVALRCGNYRLLLVGLVPLGGHVDRGVGSGDLVSFHSVADRRVPKPGREVTALTAVIPKTEIARHTNSGYFPFLHDVGLYLF